MLLKVPNWEQRTDSCYNGEQAVEKVKLAIEQNDVQRYKLILLDVNMPVMNGYDATK